MAMTHSKAYERLKQSHQYDIEIVILFCHAVPSLKAYMKAVEGGEAPKLPNPDHFQTPQPHTRIKSIIPRYKKVIGRMMFLATFSYFEAYIKSLLQEVVEFHGGKDLWAGATRRKLMSRHQDHPLAKGLREPKKGAAGSKYHSLINALTASQTFRFPSEHFAAYGILRLTDSIKEMRAADISKLVGEGLGVPITKEDWDEFEKYRDQRNEIAHGDPKEVDIKETINVAKKLFEIAKAIDQYVVKYLMVIENV